MVESLNHLFYNNATERLHIVKDNMMEALVIERTLVVKAKQQRVWAAITEPERISAWFGGKFAFARLVPGEPMTIFDEYPGEIAIVEPQDRFAFYWLAEENYTVRTLVTFTLHPEAEGTRITVTETGFEALPPALAKSRFESNSGGWETQLKNIDEYLRTKDHDTD
jgi:uncharacterized protein YndB with AHSA1/START domain